MDKHQHMPDVDRLSYLAAVILLAYALMRLINLPLTTITIQLPFFYLPLNISLRTLVVLLLTIQAAAGAEWLVRDHPFVRRAFTPEHWMLPALTAWVVGIPLFQLPLGVEWWLGFLVGGAVLMMVLVAEYIVVDPDDMRQPLAATGLTIYSFALFLFLAAALRSVETRLSLLLPAMTLAAGLVSLRTLHLRLHGVWAFLQSLVIALLIAQAVAAVYYWAISPVSFSMFITGLAYALTSFIAGLAEGVSGRQSLVEPAVVLLVLWGTALWIR